MTGAQWITTIAGLLGALTGVGALLNAFFGRGKTRAEATQILTGTAVAMMNEFEADARAARADAAGLREEMKTVRSEARALADELYQLRTAIMQPTATLEGVRAIVVGGTNGRRI